MEGRQLVMVLSPKKTGKGVPAAKAKAAPKKDAAGAPKAKAGAKKAGTGEPKQDAGVVAEADKKAAAEEKK